MSSCSRPFSPTREQATMAAVAVLHTQDNAYASQYDVQMSGSMEIALQDEGSPFELHLEAEPLQASEASELTHISDTPTLLTPPPPLKQMRTVPDGFKIAEWIDRGELEKIPPLKSVDSDELEAKMEAEQLFEQEQPTSSQLQVTVLQVAFSSTTPIPGKPDRTVPLRSHWIRIVCLMHPRTRVSTAYVHVLDIVNFIHHAFGSTQMQPAELEGQPYFRKLQRYMTRLCDEETERELTHSSTASVSMLSWLISLRGYQKLLQRDALVERITKLTKHFGEAFKRFLEVTIVCNLQVLNQGPQPLAPKSPPAQKPASKKRSRSAAPATMNNNDESKEEAADNDSDASSTGAAGEWDVHCILNRTNHLYKIHWCDRSGLPFPASHPDACTWEHTRNIEESCPEVVREFREGGKCEVFKRERKRKRRKQKIGVGEEEDERRENVRMEVEEAPAAAASAASRLPAAFPSTPTSTSTTPASIAAPTQSTAGSTTPVDPNYRCPSCHRGFLALPELVQHRRTVHQSPVEERNLVKFADQTATEHARSPVITTSAAAAASVTTPPKKKRNSVELEMKSTSSSITSENVGSRVWLGEEALIAETKPLVRIHLEESFGVPFLWMSCLQQLLDFANPQNAVAEVAHQHFGLGAIEDFVRQRLSKRKDVLVATYALGLPLVGDVKRMKQAIITTVKKYDTRRPRAASPADAAKRQKTK